MSFIWATRGRDWGFRFLSTGGFEDPLPEYDRLFTDDGYEPTLYCHRGSTVAVRFPDPEGRTDAAGRVIPHEFVVFPPLSDQIASLEQGITVLWPMVADKYAAKY